MGSFGTRAPFAASAEHRLRRFERLAGEPIRCSITAISHGRLSDQVGDLFRCCARVLIKECDACGSRLSLRVALGEAVAIRCPYCHDPADIASIAEEKARVIDELEAGRRAVFTPQAGLQADREFSIVICMLLLAAFWPAGLWYCWPHRGTIGSFSV